MTKFIISSLLIFLQLGTVNVFSQVTINSLIPSSGIVQRSQLWQFVIASRYAASGNGRIVLSCKDLHSSQIIFTATTSRFIIPPGSKTYQLREVAPVSYENINSPNSVDASALMPVGEYLLCFQLYYGQNDGEEIAGEDCVQAFIEPLTPLTLVAPADRDSVNPKSLLFNWLAPSPAAMFTGLSYDLLVTEVLPDQSPVDAISGNVPLFVQTGLISTSKFYPVTASVLQSGKNYAWQVQVRDVNNYSGKSEVWQFYVPKSIIVSSDSSSPYITVNQLSTKPVFIRDGMLKVEFQNDEIANVADVVIVDISKPDVPVSRFEVSVSHGKNFIQVDLRKHIKVEENEKVYEAFFSTKSSVPSRIKFCIRPR